ncbi:O-antigen polymerase [Winogradskyella aurantia]|uniref:Oligosaccharide repeat unit polymerase n=1 Tax=Winogradskyella aurantia TaxID=1915063 RepID=A0A265V0J5_9FLAO|nr:O-antigen polymerase [Winogradskyella aurantia]OZV70817.1 hypothetical protein CA834_01505 [Winogradskyella aurantia]
MVILSVPYYFFYEEKFSIAEVDEITSMQFWDVLNMYLIANIAFIIGFLIYHKVSTSRIKEVYNRDLNYSLFTKYKIPSYFSKIAYILSFIVIVCYLATYGDMLLQRQEYIPIFDKKFLITIAKVLSLVCSIILGLIYSKNKPLSVVLIITILVFTFGTGSRISFLILMLYFLTIFQMTGNTRANKLRFLLQIILSFVFLSYLISLRQLKEHGVIPYIATLFTEDSQILESIAFNIYYSFVFGLFATARTLSESDPNWYYIYVSVNPLPGSIVGWPDVAKELMITRFMPYTLHGQVFKMGYTFLIVFFFILGVVFSFFEKVIRKYLIRGKKRTAVLFALILALFVFYSFEYHLRSALRYIYYAYFILLVIWFLNMMWKLLPKKVVE